MQARDVPHARKKKIIANRLEHGLRGCALSSSSCPGISPAAWYGALYSAAESYGIAASTPISAALYNPYSWALLAVLLFSVLTGWNRRFAESGENGETA